MSQGKPAPFKLITFVGAPLSQTIHGMILMITMTGKADAHCADALAEMGQGFSNDPAVIGIVETVAIFVLVFTILALG